MATRVQLAPPHDFAVEHARLRAGIYRIRQLALDAASLDPAGRRRRLESVLHFAGERLERHAQAESRVLYPHIARALRHPAAIGPMAYDHELVGERVEALRAIDPDDVGALEEQLFSLYALLDAHLRKQERFYMPLLQDEAELAEVFEEMQAIEHGRAIAGPRVTKLGRHDFPMGATAGERLAWAVRYAILAPSSHNAQPWRFVVTDDALELRADRTRALPVSDPDDRELTIGCGAALFHLETAMRKVGETAEAELLPEPADADLLARVRLGLPRPPTRPEEQLFWAIRTRHTNRRRFDDKPVPEAILLTLQQAAAAEGAELVVLAEEAARERLAALVAEGDRIQARDPSFRRELAAWLHSNRQRTADGMPGYAHGYRRVSSEVAPLVVRRFDWGRGRAAHDRELALGSPVLALLTTRADEPRDWLLAGRALAAVLLRGTFDDVVASFLNQPLEVEELRPQVAELAGGGVPQLVLRLGFARPATATPRRPVAEVLEGRTEEP